MSARHKAWLTPDVEALSLPHPLLAAGQKACRDFILGKKKMAGKETAARARATHAAYDPAPVASTTMIKVPKSAAPAIIPQSGFGRVPLIEFRPP